MTFFSSPVHSVKIVIIQYLCVSFYSSQYMISFSVICFLKSVSPKSIEHSCAVHLGIIVYAIIFLIIQEGSPVYHQRKHLYSYRDFEESVKHSKHFPRLRTNRRHNGYTAGQIVPAVVSTENETFKKRHTCNTQKLLTHNSAEK